MITHEMHLTLPPDPDSRSCDMHPGTRMFPTLQPRRRTSDAHIITAPRLSAISTFHPGRSFGRGRGERQCGCRAMDSDVGRGSVHVGGTTARGGAAASGVVCGVSMWMVCERCGG